MNKIKVIFKKALTRVHKDKFKVSCQSACKTSCTVANQTIFIKSEKKA